MRIQPQRGDASHSKAIQGFIYEGRLQGAEINGGLLTQHHLRIRLAKSKPDCKASA